MKRSPAAEIPRANTACAEREPGAACSLQQLTARGDWRSGVIHRDTGVSTIPAAGPADATVGPHPLTPSPHCAWTVELG